ncbi:hypothetical protein [Natronorarus salvus]|uniref:hypothetical protein n=1 Tax=Natronorarus salvus TaxID=3117733 RepID=UPI002F260554
MTWITVPDGLRAFKYADYGMTRTAEVTSNGKANVPEDVAEQLENHPSGEFARVDADDDTDTDDTDNT